MSLDEHTLRVVARWFYWKAAKHKFEDDCEDEHHIAELLGNANEIIVHLDHQRTRREKARRCEDCKWCGDVDFDPWCCKADAPIKTIRRNAMCGPSGRLWEAK